MKLRFQLLFLLLAAAIVPAQSSRKIDIDSHLEALSSTDLAVIRDALTALDMAGPAAKKAVPKIALLLGDTRCPPANYIGSGVNLTIGERSSRALAAIGEPSVDALTHTIETGSSAARRYAVAGLGRIAHPSVARGLLLGLEDSEEETRNLSRLYLSQGEAKLTAAIFVNACKNTDPFVRSTALLVLGRIRDRDAADTVLHLLHDSDASVRDSALLVLVRGHGWINDKRAFSPLLTALKHKNASVRGGAAASLGQYKDQNSLSGASKTPCWRAG